MGVISSRRRKRRDAEDDIFGGDDLQAEDDLSQLSLSKPLFGSVLVLLMQLPDGISNSRTLGHLAVSQNSQLSDPVYVISIGSGSRVYSLQLDNNFML